MSCPVSTFLTQLAGQRLTDLPSTLRVAKALAVIVGLQLEWTDRHGPAFFVDRHEGQKAGIGVPLHPREEILGEHLDPHS